MFSTPFPRAFYVPKDRPVRVRQFEDLPATVVLYDRHDRPYAMGWRGKARKPAFHHRFRDASHREGYIARWLEGQRETAASKAKWRAARNQPHTLHVGKVLTCSWGYDQTNVDWFEVTAVIGKHTVEIREIGAVPVGEQGGPQERVAPRVGQYIGPAMRKRATADNRVKVGHHYASPWDGTPRQKTGFGWGH